jgi:hydroxymethylbilane synthase
MTMPDIPAHLTSLRIGSRGSALALWQTHYVRDLLLAAWPALQIDIKVMKTEGDRVLDTPLPLIGGKGLFTAELEAALREGHIDLAVHSLKDLPTIVPGGLAIGATPPRVNPADVLVSRAGHTVESLPEAAAVGSSSLRRAAQLRCLRPDLQIFDIRGNVDTRLRKLFDPDGPYDAILLARAGLERLDRLDVVSEVLTGDQMLPAPGQGSLAIQCRTEDAALALLAPLHDPATWVAVTAERAFLAGLGGGCSLPVAAHSVLQDGLLQLRGRVTAVDGAHQIDLTTSGPVTEAAELGYSLAQSALAQGAGELLPKRGG